MIFMPVYVAIALIVHDSLPVSLSGNSVQQSCIVSAFRGAKMYDNVKDSQPFIITFTHLM